MRPFLSPPRVAGAALADVAPRNAQENGASLRLLTVAQRSPRGLPDDDAKLARWARVSLRTFRRIKPAVMASWILADGRWTPQRPSSERQVVGRPADNAGRNGRHGRPLSAGRDADRGRAADAMSDALPAADAAKPADLRALARRHGAGAVRVLATIMHDPAAPLGARLAAAQALLDRGFGRPTGKADDAASAPVPREFTRIIVTPGERDGGGS